jgi:hypothetical protein
MLLDLNLAEPAPRAAMACDPPGFRPHGLSLFMRGSEPARLFAISHRPDGSGTHIAARGPLSAGTVAAHWHDEFLVGALLDSKVLICKPSP